MTPQASLSVLNVIPPKVLPWFVRGLGGSGGMQLSKMENKGVPHPLEKGTRNER